MQMRKEVLAKRKIKIGYLVPSWQDADVIFFRRQLLIDYTRLDFQVYCYVDGLVASYQEFQDGVSRWRDVSNFSIEKAVQLIHHDRLDILVDLSGYHHNRFWAILGFKPASVQICFVGSYNTTKLTTVDYIFTDKYCDPMGRKEDYFTEKLYRLSQTHFCYTVPQSITPNELPFEENGYITFGSLHHFTRVTDGFLQIWAEILKQLPTARLLLKSRVFGSGASCQEVRYRLDRLGFPVERVELLSVQYTDKELYPYIDIILDTFPYTGGETTCEAIYRGIPVLTLAGSQHKGRLGYSILKNISLEECIAQSEQEYIKKALLLAGNSYKLKYLHKNLPERILKSPLMDSPRFVSRVERAYNEIIKLL